MTQNENDLIVKNVCKLRRAPRVAESEMVIVQDVPGLVDKLRGSRLYVPAIMALFTGMRLGEVLALRWSRVDLDGKTISVGEALESTKAHGIRFKAPKSRAGRRDITLPDIVVEALREHRKCQLELRMQLGAGRLADEALLFANLDGKPLQPSNVSSHWVKLARRIGVPGVSFHALRHTHASQLIEAGVDIVTISKRLGARQAKYHPRDLRPHVYNRRPQGCGGHQRGLGRFVKALGGNRVATFAFVLAGVRAK
jgi:integrase